MSRLLQISGAACIALTFCTASLANDRIVGHRAVYDLALGDTSDRAGVNGASGRYVFDLEDTCDGYVINERLVLQLFRNENPPILTDYRMSAFEAADGTVFEYATETSYDNITADTAEGVLQNTSAGAQLDFTHDTLDDVKFDTPVLTPIAHIRALLAAAQNGDARHSGVIIDGDVRQPAFEAVTRIIAADPEKALEEATNVLEGRKRWFVDAAFFTPEQSEDDSAALPEFAFSGLIFDNGVMSSMTLDYIDFTLDARLNDLELRDSGC